jgi:hypothetical protein
LITREHTQEALSTAYVHALAGMAGLNIGTRAIQDYGVDGTFHRIKIRNGERVQTGHSLVFQAKASTDWSFRDGVVVYDLEARAQRFLTDRERGEAMAILILLCLPKEPEDWLGGDEQHLRLQHCCYWYLPEAAELPSENKSTARIFIPRANVLTPSSLQDLMALAREKAMGS